MDTKRFAYRIRALAIGCSRPQRRGAGSFYKFTAVITPLGAPQVFAPLRRQSAVGALLKRGPATLAGAQLAHWAGRVNGPRRSSPASQQRRMPQIRIACKSAALGFNCRICRLNPTASCEECRRSSCTPLWKMTVARFIRRQPERGAPNDLVGYYFFHHCTHRGGFGFFGHSGHRSKHRVDTDGSRPHSRHRLFLHGSSPSGMTGASHRRFER